VRVVGAMEGDDVSVSKKQSSRPQVEHMCIYIHHTYSIYTYTHTYIYTHVFIYMYYTYVFL
jgi:hypothetical protein